MEKPYLLTPGPVVVSQPVLDELAKPVVHHRTDEFRSLFASLLQDLKKVFGTENDVMVLTATGSGAMEAAIVNTLTPSDTVIAVVGGKFGERWADIASAFGMDVIRIDIPWGQACPPEKVKETLERHPRARAVLCQACETSTGVWHPVQEIATIVAETKGCLFMVDGVSAVGATPLPMDDWNIDVLHTGSQKGMMLPTGLSCISLSDKAWSTSERSGSCLYYWNLKNELESNRKGDSFFSAPTSQLRAMRTGVTAMLEKGLEQIYTETLKRAKATREGGTKLGLSLYSQSPSPSLTAFNSPAEMDSSELQKRLQNEFGIIVMGGQGQLKGKIFRVGHMGDISDKVVLESINAIGRAIDADETKINDAMTVAEQRLST